SPGCAMSRADMSQTIFPLALCSARFRSPRRVSCCSPRAHRSGAGPTSSSKPIRWRRDVLVPADVRSSYDARVARGEIERDTAQETVLDRLGRLESRLRQHRLARKSSSLGWLFGARERTEEPIRGLYIFGEVGRGKTMLMD